MRQKSFKPKLKADLQKHLQQKQNYYQKSTADNQAQNTAVTFAQKIHSRIVVILFLHIFSFVLFP